MSKIILHRPSKRIRKCRLCNETIKPLKLIYTFERIRVSPNLVDLHFHVKCLNDFKKDADRAYSLEVYPNAEIVSKSLIAKEMAAKDKRIAELEAALETLDALRNGEVSEH
jgi:hypothetical protein